MKYHPFTPKQFNAPSGPVTTDWCSFTEPPLAEVKPGDTISMCWQSANHKLHKRDESSND